MKKVFLGGTCNNSQWRNKLIELLTIDYFNPVVEEWTSECKEREIQERKTCDFCLYVITPLMTGVYSIAEVIDDSNKRPEKTLFCVLDEDYIDTNLIFNSRKIVRFNEMQLHSLEQVKHMVETNGSKCFNSLQEIANFLNLNK